MHFMSMIIRAAKTTDIPNLALLHAGFRRVHIAQGADTFAFESASPDVSAFFADLLHRDNTYLLLAEKDGRLAGYVWWDVAPHHPSPEQASQLRARIHHLQVTEEVRQRGVASKLLEAATQHCRSNGVTDVVFDAEPDETVHALFARQGFKPGRVVLQKQITHP